MATTQPQKFARFGLRILVYPNRVEIRQTIFWPFISKTTVLPAKNISTVSVGTYSKRLELTTTDGKTYKYAIGSFGKADRCREAIANLL